ncbi:MAG TPA: hypothetical protein VHA82_14740 [Ramlibacter sp.]|uniref:hypothetical protein n=1 Tax=Ramlibacter sp. TaxID=1917967 RepID=UPI002D16BF61|nr:hypothetical protein [Ramlibacter sp.]HVZ45065.1 hypothetical protein [Ramlibacter sp.]
MLNIYLFRHPESDVSEVPHPVPRAASGDAGGLAVTTRQEATRIGRFLSMVTSNAIELYCGPEQAAMEYARLIASPLESRVRHDVRLRRRREQLADSWMHRVRVRDWFDAIVMPRRDEDITIVVVAHRDTVNHVMACFLGAVERSLTDHVFEHGSGNFHLIRSVPAKEAGTIWKIECVDSPI